MIGQQIKSFRKKQKLSLRELAKKINTSPSTISRFENGNLDIAYSTVLAIFEALGQPQQHREPYIILTKNEREYILLLTALDALRIKAMESDIQQDYHYQIRHNVRSKLFELEKMELDSTSEEV